MKMTAIMMMMIWTIAATIMRNMISYISTMIILMRVMNARGRFLQEAYMSNFQDQRKANMAISEHEGLAIGIFAIKCWGRYNCLKICPPKMGRHFFFLNIHVHTRWRSLSIFL